VQEVGPVSDAKATLLAKLKKMAERMRPAEIAAPLKDVTPLIEHEPSADAKTESVTKSVTKPVASVTKSPTAMTPVTKKRAIDLKFTSFFVRAGQLTNLRACGGWSRPSGSLEGDRVGTPPPSRLGGRRG
jgi:hypothetical protein